MTESAKRKLAVVKSKICNIILTKYDPEYNWIDLEGTIRHYMVGHIEYSEEEID